MSLVDYCRWLYLGLELPAGVTPGNLVCLYQFNESPDGLTDRSGNGHNLTLNGGTEIYTPTERVLGVAGLELRNDRFAAAPTGLSPQTLGAFTVECIWTPGVWTVDDDSIFDIRGATAGELEDDNASVSLWVGNEPGMGRYWAQHEYGAGLDSNNYFTFGGTLNTTQLVTLTRAADGVTYKLSLQGELVETVVAANPPTGGGGANVRIRVGGYSFGNDVYGALHSLRYVKEEFTAAQVLASYLEVRAESCGLPGEGGGGDLAGGPRFRVGFDPDRRSGPRQEDGSLQSDLLISTGVQNIAQFDGGTLED